MATATKTEVIAALSVELAKPDYVTLPVTGKGSKTSLLLTKPEISNPDPAPQVQAPADPAALFNPVPADELAAIDDGLLGRVMDAVEDGNLQRVSLQIQVAVARGYISSGTATALATALQATVDDPDHPATVFGPSPWETILADNNWTTIEGLPSTGGLPTSWIEEAAQ